MARHKSVLALLSSILLLATVITAFRLRDLSQKQVSSRSNPLLETCKDCESDVQPSVSLFKAKDTFSYKDIKNAVKEKQQSIKEKKQLQQQKWTSPKIEHQGSDDDDRHLKISKHVDVSKATNRYDLKYTKDAISHPSPSSPKSLRVSKKKILKIESDDDSDKDEDDYDSGDDDDNSDKVELEIDDDYDDNGDDDNDKNRYDEDDSGNDDDKEVNDEESDESGTDSEGDTAKKNVQSYDDSKNDYNSGNDNGENDSDDEFVRHANKNQLKLEIKAKDVQLKNRQHQITKTTVSTKADVGKNLKNTKIHLDESEDDDNNNENEDDEDEESDEDSIVKKMKTITSSKSKNVEKKIKIPQEKETHIYDDEVDATDDSEDYDDRSDDEEEIKVVITKTPKIVTDKTKIEKVGEKSKRNISEKSPPINLKQAVTIQSTDFKNVSAQNDKKEEIHKVERAPMIDKNEKIDNKLHQDKHVVSKSGHGNFDKQSGAKKEVKKHTEIRNEKLSETKHEPKIAKMDKEKSEPSHREVKSKSIKRQREALERASDALFRKNNFIQSEFEDFYAFLPSFSPNFSRIHNPECRRHGQILMRQLRGTKLWALNMLDASGKLSSGILDGNGNQLGNLEQCLSSRARVKLDSGHVVKIRGKYCLAQIDLRTDQPELHLPVHLAQARNLLKSKVDDPGHFIPRFSSLNWGICLPEACESDDAEFVLRDSLRHYHLAGIGIRINIDPVNCHTDADDDWENWLDPPTLGTLTLFFGIALLVIFATLKDFLARRSSEKVEREAAEEKEETEENAKNAEAYGDSNKNKGNDNESIISSFSLYRSCSKLLRPGDSEDIACIHGIRAVCSLCLLLAHKTIPIANTPFLNRGQFTELSHEAVSIPLRLGWLYTDAFLLLSGALTAHRLSADADSETSPSWFRRYVARYVRLTPALIGCVLFYAYVWDHIGRGPQWGTLVTHNARLCQDSWWWNLLYLQNFLSFEEMCAPQTYQLAVDMQLTLFAAALVWALRTRPVQAAGVLIGLQALAAYLRYSATEEHRLTLLIYHGASVSQLYRTANLTYSSTLHRCTPYIVGVLLGVLLQRKPDTKLSLWLCLPCWCAWALCCGGVSHPALEAAEPHYRYSAASAAVYAAFAPPAAAAALAWFIYAAHSGNAEWLNRMLQTRMLVLVSRLSYAMYLCQFVIFFTNVATVSASREFSIISILDLGELAMILAASTMTTLTLVIPIQSLSKFVMCYKFGAKDGPTEETCKENQENIDENKEDEYKQETTEAEEFQERFKSYNGTKIMAHREALEEISEAEYEYESQRDVRNEGLEEILEEEEEELADEEVGEEELEPEEELGEEELQEEQTEDIEGEEDMEFVERADVEEAEIDGREVNGGEEDFWGHVQEEEVYVPRRLSREDDTEEPWDWRGGQGSRFSRYR